MIDIDIKLGAHVQSVINHQVQIIKTDFRDSPHQNTMCTILRSYISLSHRDREGIFESYGSEEHLDADEEVLVACCHGSRLK